MNAIAQWLKEKGKIVIPKTLDTQVFDENGKSLDRRLKTAKDEQVIQLPKVDPTMIFSDLDYSTEEQLTGKRWIDGKPIYQKTVVIDTPSVTGKDIRYPHGIENVDEIIDGKTKYIRSDGVSYTEPIYIGNSSVRACAFDATDIIITLQSMNISIIKVTIFYTKTTDTASSPVALPKVEAKHVYSTEEKVVGTWIDGRPVYEKTINLSDTRVTGEAFEIVFLENIDFLVKHSVMFKDTNQNGAKYILANYTGTALSWFSGNQMYITSNNDLVFRFDGAGGDLEIFGVIQYTKTTDTATT